MPLNYDLTNVVSQVLGEPWAITPEKAHQISSLLNRRLDANSQYANDYDLSVEFGEPMSRSRDNEPDIRGGVQVISVHGTLMPRATWMMKYSGGTSTMELARQIDAADKNPDVKAIVLDVDSPGGAASYVAEAATLVQNTKTRVVGVGTNIAASGAYWLLAAGDKAYASEGTSIGSVGVYVITQEVVKAAEKAGITYRVFKAGDVKAAGNPYETMSSKAQAAIQTRIDAIYDMFVSALANYRGITVSQVEERFGQGTVYLAQEAAARGMIDGVKTLEQVIAEEQAFLSQSTISSGRTRVMKVTNRVKAALFACGIVSEADASDEVCESAIRVACLQRGLEPDQANEQELVSAITAASLGSVDAKIIGKPVTVPPADKQDDIEAGRVADKQDDDTHRVTELRARAQILNVSEEDLWKAIEDGTSLEEASATWFEALSDVGRKPVTRDNDRITSGISSADKITDGAAEVLIARSHEFPEYQPNEEDRAYGESFRSLNLVGMYRQLFASGGDRMAHMSDGDDIALLALQNVRGMHILNPEASANRTGQSPDIINSLMNKVMTQETVIANLKHTTYARQVENLRDFMPRAHVDVGFFGELDGIQEGDESNEKVFQSESRSWLQLGRYANKVKLTLEMIANEQLGAFTRQLRTFRSAPSRTLEKLCRTTLVNNPTCWDGTALFHADHNNLLSSGAAPSSAQAEAMREAHRLQKSFGASDEHPMDEPPVTAYVPANWETQAKQTFMYGVYDPKVANTDATINTVRGEITPVVDSRLDFHDNLAWYTFVDPSMCALIIWATRNGYGNRGKQMTWFENETKSRVVDIEAQFAVSPHNWRAAQKNPGQ